MFKFSSFGKAFSVESRGPLRPGPMRVECLCLLGCTVLSPLGDMSQAPKFSIAIKGLDIIQKVPGSHGRFLSRADGGTDTDCVDRKKV